MSIPWSRVPAVKQVKGFLKNTDQSKLSIIHWANAQKNNWNRRNDSQSCIFLGSWGFSYFNKHCLKCLWRLVDLFSSVWLISRTNADRNQTKPGVINNYPSQPQQSSSSVLRLLHVCFSGSYEKRHCAANHQDKDNDCMQSTRGIRNGILWSKSFLYFCVSAGVAALRS